MNSCRRSEKGRLLRRTAAAKTRGDWGCCCPSRGTWPATPSLIPCRKDTSLQKIGTRRWTTCIGWVIETRSNCRSIAHKHLPDSQRTAHYVLTQCIISLCSIHAAAVQLRLDGRVSDCRQLPRSLFGAQCDEERRTERHRPGMYSNGIQGQWRRAIVATSC